MKEISKTILISLLCTIFLPLMGHSSPLATFNQKVFYVPNRGPVIETYFEIAANSIVLKDDGNGILKGQVQLTLIFRQDSTIVTFDKKTIDSPEMTQGNLVDFLDVQRFALPPGNYILEIELKDMLDPEAQVQQKELEITIPNPPEGIFISDIELVSAFKKTETPGIYSKSGYDLLPMVDDDVLNAEMKEVVLYAEIYGTEANTDGKYLVRAYMENATNPIPIESTFKLSRMEAKPVNPLLLRLPIEKVESGNYNIVIEVRSSANELLAVERLPVNRRAIEAPKSLKNYTDAELANTWVAKYNNKPVLFEHIKSLRPIAGQAEKNVIDNTFREEQGADLQYLQRYLYSFWIVRNDTNSEQAWLDYNVKVQQAQKEFGTANKRGYETDQGRVYLQYGAPNDIVKRPTEPSTYPYIIWRYYNVANRNNVKFVFYDPMITGNDYQLLHTENIPGEITNYRWKLILQQRTTGMDNVDAIDTPDQYGRQFDDLFDNPR